MKYLTDLLNDENRLIRVQGPGSVDCAYSYDSMGRMLTRDDGTDLTRFTWHGGDMIREQTGMSTTSYCIPEGALVSFIRDGSRYDVHKDHLMSVRMVTNESGEIVLRREFDAWGVELSSNFDSRLDGFAYGFVGGAGCRRDLASGLVYMRARHYDPTVQRFLSKDPVGLQGGSNLYRYCINPVDYIDPSGLWGEPTTEQKYIDLYHYWATSKDCKKKDCKEFIKFLKLIANTSSSDGEFWDLNRMLFIPSNAIPRLPGNDIKTQAKNALIDHYFPAKRSYQQKDITRFTEDGWNPRYRNDAAYGSTDQTHHLMLVLYAGSQGALSSPYANEVRAGLTQYETNTQQQMHFDSMNLGDFLLSQEGIGWGEEFYQLKDKNPRGQQVQDWIARLEKLICK